MNNVYKFNLCICLAGMLLLCNLALAQIPFPMPDSLRVQIEKEESPENRVAKLLTYINSIGSTHLDSAIVLHNALIKMYEEQHFSYGVGRVKSLKAWHLCFSAKYEESLRIAHEALALQKRISDSMGIALTFNRLGIINLQLKRHKDARRYLDQAFGYFMALHDSDRIDMVLNNLGALASEEHKYKEAVLYYKKSLVIRTALKDTYWMAYSYYNIGEVYFKDKQTDSSRYYTPLAYYTFKEKTKKHYVPGMVSLGMGEHYRGLNNYAEAIRYTKEGIEDAEKKDHTEIILEGKQLLSELLFESGKYKEAYETQKEYQQLKTGIDSTNNASQVAEIEEQYKNAEKEAQLTLVTNEKLEAENNAQQFKVYLLVISLAFLVIIFGVVIVWLRKNQRERIQQSELNSRISEIRMIALRAQMNPHFIFNAINTAQNFIMDAEKETAYEYLSNFARLLRFVLENSDKPFIALEDELEQLRLYIELEEIRFKNKFRYTIEIDPALKSGVFEIPGMILQPLIENAIGHGLINRNDDYGKLQVTMKLEGENIICEIMDNGVGREKAQEIKVLKKISYKSAALPNIHERLKMLQSQTNSIIDLEIVDLFENNEPSGTLVRVVLPYS
jgi:hypothetical protein